MNSEGLLGAFFLAIGGAILFEGLNQLFMSYNFSPSEGVGPLGIDIIGFIGFLFVGIGLWRIVLSGKPEMKENA